MSAFQGNVTKKTGKEVEVKKRLKRLNKCFDPGIWKGTFLFYAGI